MQAERAVLHWRSLSQATGLAENAGKTKVVARADMRQQVLQSHVLRPHVVDTARILGIDFCARSNAAGRPAQDGRLQTALNRANRLHCVSWHVHCQG